MKHFWRDIVFTFILAVAMIAVLEMAIVRTTNEYSYKDWYMTENADKIKILLLGNSLFVNSFDPHVFEDSVFDGASDGRDLYYDVQILKKYTPYMSNLKVVMLPLTINYYVDAPQSLFKRHPFARYMGIPFGNNPLQYSTFFSGHFTFHDLKPTHIYSHVESKNAKGKGHDYYDSLGYSPLYYYWDQHSLSAPIRAYEEALLGREKFVSQITEMNRLCDSMGVRLIFILPPANDAYINHAGQRMYDLLDSTMQQLGHTLNLEYRFYHDDPAFRNDSLYADELHLNHIGATLFAQRVKEDFGL